MKTPATVVEGKDDLDTAHLMVLKQAVRLEAVGMKHSSGKSMRKEACRILCLRPMTGYDTVIGMLNREINRRLLQRAALQMEKAAKQEKTNEHR